MQRIQIGLQIGQADGRVGADLIEIVHDGGLGDHRQLTERSAVQAAVEVPVERGALGRERPQRRNLPPLVRLQLRPAPPLVTAQAAPQPQFCRPPDPGGADGRPARLAGDPGECGQRTGLARARINVMMPARITMAAAVV
jgi:hypothetical protein